MEEDNENLGLLGQYGVVIVPPSNGYGQWFVTLASWDGEAEEYVAGSDGPILETREEAVEEAGKVMDWLQTQSHEEDLAKAWQHLQDRISAPDIGESYPRQRWPWHI